MCPFVIIIIMIALVLFMPAVYQMGKIRGYKSKKVENAEGGVAASTTSTTSTTEATLAPKGLPSVLPPTKCTTCKKMKICANPPDGMGVFRL